MADQEHITTIAAATPATFINLVNITKFDDVGNCRMAFIEEVGAHLSSRGAILCSQVTAVALRDLLCQLYGPPAKPN